MNANCPPPGIYLEVPFSQYRLWPYPSKSSLSQIKDGAAHYKAYVEGKIPQKSSDAFTIGAATEDLFNGLELIESNGWVIAPDDLPKTGKKRQAWEDSLGTDVRGINKAQVVIASNMAAALNGYAIATQIRDQSQSQVSLVWDDPRTGRRIKGRPDYVDFENRVLSDLKTCRNNRHGAFSRDCGDYGYHVQLAMYVDGLIANGAKGDWLCKIISVRNQPVHTAAVREMPHDAIALGRWTYSRWLTELKFAHGMDRWEPIMDCNAIKLPRYLFAAMDADWED